MSSSSTAETAPKGPTRPPTTTERSFISDLLLLYQLHPSERAYAHYTSQAVFHDPVSIAEGLDSIKSQFNGMPKLFAESETLGWDVLAQDSSSVDGVASGDGGAGGINDAVGDKGSRVLAVHLVQRYVFKSAVPFKSGGGVEKTVVSRVRWHLNEQGLILRHDEEWDYGRNKTAAEDGFFGKMMEARKEAGAKMIEKMVPSDPSKV